MALFAVTVVGRDRPGIVAALSRVLVGQRCNLEDTEMTVLRGQFAMILIVAAPASLTAADLKGTLVSGTADFDLAVTAGMIPEPAGSLSLPGATRWSVTLYGSDRPGIVAGITGILAEQGVNIVSMETRVIGDPGQPVYAMSLDVEVPGDASGPVVARRLGERADELGVACTMRPHDPDIL
jgi:glycine cleavage system transcriptional repressor